MTANIDVRLTTPDDVMVLARMRAAWLKEKTGVVADADFGEWFADWFEREVDHRRTWIVSVDGEPAGMANLLVFERMPSPARRRMRWGYVANVYVRAEHRDAGVGRVLLEAVIAWATDEELERLVLNPSDRSVPFYARLGFAPPPKLLQLDLPVRSDGAAR